MLPNTLKNDFLSYWKAKNFNQSWIINTNNPNFAANELMLFLEEILADYTQISAENNPDIHIVETKAGKNGELQKSITIDNIRTLQNNLSTTSSVSPYRFAIVKSAHLLNINAQNSFLKLLEDTPPYCYIFLITNNKNLLLPTINSRCVVYEQMYEKKVTIEDYSKIINIISSLVYLEEKQKQIDEITKDSSNELFNNFCEALLNLLLIFSKAQIGEELSKEETQILLLDKVSEYYQTLKTLEFSVENYLSLYQDIKDYYYHTNEHNLDVAQIMLMIVCKFQIIRKYEN